MKMLLLKAAVATPAQVPGLLQVLSAMLQQKQGFQHRRQSPDGQ
jgi:hypothetical protein